jgi:hypothetical protein
VFFVEDGEAYIVVQIAGGEDVRFLSLGSGSIVAARTMGAFVSWEAESYR